MFNILEHSQTSGHKKFYEFHNSIIFIHTRIFQVFIQKLLAINFQTIIFGGEIYLARTIFH